MKLNGKIRILFSLFLISIFIGCSEDENKTVSYTDGFATLVDPVEDPIVISDNVPLVLKATGIEPNDVLLIRSTENPQNEIIGHWGYLYTGKDENNQYTYDHNQVIFQIKSDDRWTYGSWDIILQRNNERQILSTIRCQVLKLKEESPVNTSDLFKNIFYVSADGWMGRGTDYYEYKNKTTSQVITFDSDISPSDIPAPYQNVMISFGRDSLSTGSYEFYVRRWGYNFRQKICDLDYFKIEMVNNDPMVKEANGQYGFDIYLDKVVANDRVGIGSGSRGATHKVTASNFNSNTNVYHAVFTLPPSFRPGDVVDMDVVYSRQGANLSLGKKQLIVTNP